MKRFLLLSLILLTLQHLNAQTVQLKFDHFTEKDGLPDPQVQFIKQDDQGYIWIGTVLGLVRYDGYRQKVCRLGHQNSVLSMVTDRDNNVWFSTHFAGLYRYDRNLDTFISFRYPLRKDENSLTSMQLEFADDEGNLWGYDKNRLAPQHRVVKFNAKDKGFNYFGNSEDEPHKLNITSSVFQSRANGHSIWVGTKNGLYKYNEKDGHFNPYFPVVDTARQKSVCKIAEAPSSPGILWLNVFDHFSKRFIIERFDTRNKTFKDFNHLANPQLTASDDTVNDVYEDSRHRLWFATQRGLMLFSGQSQTFAVYVPADTDREVKKNQIYKIVEDKSGALWLGCGKGLLYFNPETHVFHRYTANANDPNSLSWNVLNSLFVDQSGILWISNDQYGVDKLNPLTSAFHTSPVIVRDGSAYHNGVTNNITVSAGGYCWFTNNHGIYKWKPGDDKPVQIYKISKAGTGIDAIMIGTDKKVYFGNGNGLQVYDPVNHQLQCYASNENDASSISSNKINFLFQDHTGIVWAGTEDKGICTFNPVSHLFKRYPYYNGNPGLSAGKLDNRVVNTIFEDKQGVIWVGTNNGGLNRFDAKTGKFRSYFNDGNVEVGSIDHIFGDREGRLWVGTYPNGLWEFNPKKGCYTRHINEDSGLLFNTVSGITEDSKGFLWVNSARGLTRVDPRNLSVKTYPIKAVLPAKSNLYDYNLVQINDLMVMVLTDGVASFNANELEGNPYPPIVHIEKVSYSNPASTSDSVTGKYSYGLKKIDLPWNQNRVTFSYVALHFTNPLQNRYAYRLTGYDNNWVQAGSQRSATYTNLAPGTYTFRVKASNSAGVWNNTGDSFTIVINAPWWQRWWAWCIYAAMFVAAVYGFAAYRSRKLRRDNRLLEYKIKLRTEEVIQQKEEISAQRDNLEQTLGELKTAQNQLIQSEKMASLVSLTAGIAHEIQNPLNFVNNFSEVSAELLDELDNELDKGDIEEAKAIGADLKQNLQKINHHGKRADAIVKGMLQHSQSSGGKKELTDINALTKEYLRLAYNGLRAKDKNFNADMVTNFDETVPKINVIPQDIGRVLLNLFNNAFYAVSQKQKTAGSDYKPEVSVTTSLENGQVTIKVKDNGVGIPDAIKDKIMQPFFTTKPTGEGTGLGLSLTYDMVVKGHGGSIQVESVEGEGSEFIVTLPTS